LGAVLTGGGDAIAPWSQHSKTARINSMTLAVLLRMVRFLFIFAVTIQPGTAARDGGGPGGKTYA